MITVTETATNLDELIFVLGKIAKLARRSPSEIYLGTDAPTFTIKLVERKLTDGSKVEDLVISHD